MFLAALCAERECSWLRTVQSVNIHGCALARARVLMAALWPGRECSWLRSGHSASVHGCALARAKEVLRALVCMKVLVQVALHDRWFEILTALTKLASCLYKVLSSAR